MSHITQQELHGFLNRGLDVRIDVATSGVPGDFTDVGFRIQDVVEKTGLTPTAGGSGVLIDFTLTPAEMVGEPGWYRWECYATVASHVRTLAEGQFHVGSEPTTEEEEES
jgi:hypothetical protein